MTSSAVDSLPFAEVWAIDFEFRAAPGDIPEPICLVARELRTGRTIRMWEDELRLAIRPPYPTDASTLVVAYYASAEVLCHLALGWPLPAQLLDLYVEFRCERSGFPPPRAGGWGLLGALHHHGVTGIDAIEKQSMRELAMRGGPWSHDERTALLAYCETDVAALEQLLPRMLPRLDLRRAIHRGRFMRAAGRIEHLGVPVDVPCVRLIASNWEPIKGRLVEAIDADFGVFEGTTFKVKKFERWLVANRMSWPRHPSGKLDLSDDTFRDLSKAHPRLSPLRELRHALGKLRLHKLAIGSDGRNRTMLSAFRSSTGRNQPSNSQFIFGPSCWLRSLIRPAPGYGLAYIDWCQQEFGIAAALAGDDAMMAAYTSGDPYLEFAKQASAVPPSATKATHGSIRDLFKACVLAVQYCMGAEALAMRAGLPLAEAQDLLRLHRRLYPTYWRWAEGAVDHAMAFGWLHTVFGWRVHTTTDSNPRSLQNFPSQANGAELLRLACCLATEADVPICAPVHDAVLIESPLAQLDATVATMQKAMADASRVVLAGFELRTDVKRIEAPGRYVDERGRAMWNQIWELIGQQPDEVAHAG